MTVIKETRNWRGEARALLLRAETDYLAALASRPSPTAGALAWERHYDDVAVVVIRSAASLQESVRGIDGGTWARCITRVSRAFDGLGLALQRRDFAEVNTCTAELTQSLELAKRYVRDPSGDRGGQSTATPAPRAAVGGDSHVPAGWRWAALTEREPHSIPRWALVLAAVAVGLMVLLALSPAEAPYNRQAPPDLSDSLVNPG